MWQRPLRGIRDGSLGLSSLLNGTCSMIRHETVALTTIEESVGLQPRPLIDPSLRTSASALPSFRSLLFHDGLPACKTPRAHGAPRMN